MIALAVLTGLGAVAGVALVTVGLRPSLLGSQELGDRRRRTWRALAAVAIGNDEQALRLVGTRPMVFAAQRIGFLLAGAAVGAGGAALAGTTTLTSAVAAGAVGGAGWLVPMLGVRDSARRARDELDVVTRVWIALVAQQVTAGRDPAAAMIAAAQAGRRPAWRLLHRHLLRSQQEHRPAWEGLAHIVEHYGAHTLAPVVSAFGLANQRGTRMAEAVLIAADTLWREAVAAEREKAARRAQIIVVPATGVAFALAAILVYPPFTALTGSQVLGGP